MKITFIKNIRMFLLLKTKYRGVNAGKHVYIGTGTHIRPHAVRIGDYVSIGRYCQFGAHDIRIGNYVMISSYVGIVDRNAHDARTVGKPFIETRPTEFLPTIIENDVWIGFGSIILSGVTIGEGSIIASGSIVADSIPPYSIATSPKATVIESRFDQETARIHREMLYKEYFKS